MDRQPFDDIRALIGELRPASSAIPAVEGLGALAPAAAWITAWRGAATIHRPIIALYAGAHAGLGDVADTRARLEAIAAGGAPVSRAAQHLGAGLDVFDLAIDRPVANTGMSERECAATMAFGMEALAKQPDLLVLGALGVGVEASAAALAGAIVGRAPGDDPLQLMRQLGGRETAAIAGAIVAAGNQRAPVLLDGLPAIAAAAALHAISPAAIAHCRLGWAGEGAVADAALTALGLKPLFDLGITLTDGTGSTVALSLIKLACALATDAV
jgi:nicotinate-nucleotide--dimethylbenzimidazole phosphoribosyltransferase